MAPDYEDSLTSPDHTNVTTMFDTVELDFIYQIPPKPKFDQGQIDCPWYRQGEKYDNT